MAKRKDTEPYLKANLPSGRAIGGPFMPSMDDVTNDPSLILPPGKMLGGPFMPPSADLGGNPGRLLPPGSLIGGPMKPGDASTIDKVNDFVTGGENRPDAQANAPEVYVAIDEGLGETQANVTGEPFTPQAKAANYKIGNVEKNIQTGIGYGSAGVNFGINLAEKAVLQRTLAVQRFSQRISEKAHNAADITTFAMTLVSTAAGEISTDVSAFGHDVANNLTVIAREIDTRVGSAANLVKDTATTVGHKTEELAKDITDQVHSGSKAVSDTSHQAAAAINEVSPVAGAVANLAADQVSGAAHLADTVVTGAVERGKSAVTTVTNTVSEVATAAETAIHSSMTGVEQSAQAAANLLQSAAGEAAGQVQNLATEASSAAQGLAKSVSDTASDVSHRVTGVAIEAVHEAERIKAQSTRLAIQASQQVTEAADTVRGIVKQGDDLAKEGFDRSVKAISDAADHIEEVEMRQSERMEMHSHELADQIRERFAAGVRHIIEMAHEIIKMLPHGAVAFATQILARANAHRERLISLASRLANGIVAKVRSFRHKMVSRAKQMAGHMRKNAITAARRSLANAKKKGQAALGLARLVGQKALAAAKWVADKMAGAVRFITTKGPAIAAAAGTKIVQFASKLLSGLNPISLMTKVASRVLGAAQKIGGALIGIVGKGLRAIASLDPTGTLSKLLDRGNALLTAGANKIRQTAAGLVARGKSVLAGIGKLLGLDSIIPQIQQMVTKVRGVVNGIINRVVNFAASKGQSILGKAAPIGKGIMDVVSGIGKGMLAVPQNLLGPLLDLAGMEGNFGGGLVKKRSGEGGGTAGKVGGGGMKDAGGLPDDGVKSGPKSGVKGAKPIAGGHQANGKGLADEVANGLATAKDRAKGVAHSIGTGLLVGVNTVIGFGTGIAEKYGPRPIAGDGDLTGPFYPSCYEGKKYVDAADAVSNPTAVAIYVNGVQTPLERHEMAAQLLADQIGKPVVGIYNASGGALRDTTQCVTDKVGLMGAGRLNPATNTLRHLVSLYGSPKSDKGGLDIYAHSQGSIIVSEALREARGEGANIGGVDVTTFGNAAVTMPDNLRGLHNYTYDSDVISMGGGSNSLAARLPLMSGLYSMFGSQSTGGTTTMLHHSGSGARPHGVIPDAVLDANGNPIIGADGKPVLDDQKYYIGQLKEFRAKEQAMKERDQRLGMFSTPVNAIDDISASLFSMASTGFAFARGAGQSTVNTVGGGYRAADSGIRSAGSTTKGFLSGAYDMLDHGMRGLGNYVADKGTGVIPGMSMLNYVGGGAYNLADSALRTGGSMGASVIEGGYNLADWGLSTLGNAFVGGGNLIGSSFDMIANARARIQRKGDGDHPEVDAGALQKQLVQTGGSGAPLAGDIQGRVASHIGVDPIDARIHSGPEAAAAARGLRAEAFTIGRDVFFGAGKYDPNSRAGLSLIAHELTHVVQQSGGLGDKTRFASKSGGDAMEQEAQVVAERVLAHAGRREGLFVDSYARTYESDDGHTLTRDDSERLDRISLMALTIAERNLAAVGRGGNLQSVDVSVDLDLSSMTDTELAQNWASQIVAAVLAAHDKSSISIEKSIPTIQRYDTDEHVMMGGPAGKQETITIKGVVMNYGDVIAMGDFFENPNEIINSSSAPQLQKIVDLIHKKLKDPNSVSDDAWQQATGGKYLSLAEANVSHFAPSNSKFITSSGRDTSVNHRTTYEKYHLQAVNLAKKGLRDEALATNAFADHFLTDAFASGHLYNKNDSMGAFRAKLADANAVKQMTVAVANAAWADPAVAALLPQYQMAERNAGTGWIKWEMKDAGRFASLLAAIDAERPDILENAVAKVLHDRLNELGVEVQNGAGATWVLSGDEHLNTDSLIHGREAVAQSRQNILDALAGKVPTDPVGKVWSFTPVPTAKGVKSLTDEVANLTDPAKPTTVNAVAGIIKDKIHTILDEMVSRKKLERVDGKPHIPGAGAGTAVANPRPSPLGLEPAASPPAGAEVGQAALDSAMASGEHNENLLTNAVYFARHPDRAGKLIKEGEKPESLEWLQIRDNMVRPAQRKAGSKGGAAVQRKPGTDTSTPAKRPNTTGLPDKLKSGAESLSGISLDDVSVHHDSDKPAQLNALAYAEGSDIHLASGQEKHLAHEAWHVVQQRQGRVSATQQLRGAAINDDASLEQEADKMGAKALTADETVRGSTPVNKSPSPVGLQRKRAGDNRIVQRVILSGSNRTGDTIYYSSFDNRKDFDTEHEAQAHEDEIRRLENPAIKGDAAWEDAWQKKLKEVHDAVQLFVPSFKALDPFAIVSIRGSLATGVSKLHLLNSGDARPFNPEDFDIDAYVESDKLYREVLNSNRSEKASRGQVAGTNHPGCAGIIRAMQKELGKIIGNRDTGQDKWRFNVLIRDSRNADRKADQDASSLEDVGMNPGRSPMIISRPEEH